SASGRTPAAAAGVRLGLKAVLGDPAGRPNDPDDSGQESGGAARVAGSLGRSKRHLPAVNRSHPRLLRTPRRLRFSVTRPVIAAESPRIPRQSRYPTRLVLSADAGRYRPPDRRVNALFHEVNGAPKGRG